MAKPKLTPLEQIQRLMVAIHLQVRDGAGKGLNAVRVFLTSRVKEAVSVPAPRAIIRGPGQMGKKGPILGYRATTPATAGAPPRKLSGRLRSSITSKMLSKHLARIGANAKGMPSPKHPEGFPYPKYHEMVGLGPGSGKHPFIRVTAAKYQSEMNTIMGAQVAVGLRTT